MAQSLYIIGQNAYGELGLGHEEFLSELSKHPHPNIIDVKCGNQHYIYIDKHKNYYSSGYNYYGQCGINNNNRTVTKLTEINYFQKRSTYFATEIKKVCMSIGGSTTFWITKNNELYGNGRNNTYQLGIGNKNNNRSRNHPVLILDVKNAVHVCSAWNYSVALCIFYLHTILAYFLRINTQNIKIFPNVINNLIETYYGNTNRVYSTTYSLYGGNGHGCKSYAFNNGLWHEIAQFSNIKIIQITTGFQHSLFLDENGIVWSCGRNALGQLGLDDIFDATTPTKIKYFLNKNVKIKQIASGSNHNLALDSEKRLFSWGDNFVGQCGNGTTLNQIRPKLIGTNVKNIACGDVHSYFCTYNGNHFLFGCNEYLQCINDEDNKPIKKPCLINELIENKTDKLIKRVICGYGDTLLILKEKKTRGLIKPKSTLVACDIID